MIIFGVGCFLVFSVLELRPRRFTGLRTLEGGEKLSGSLIIGASALHGLVCIADFLVSGGLAPLAQVILGDVLIVAGVGLRYAAIFQLGGDFQAAVGPIKSGQVTSTGLYRLIRHPSYAGTLLYSLGLCLLFNSSPSLLTFTMLSACTVYRIGVEEHFLAHHHPETYGSYQRATKRLVPFIY